MLIATTDWIDGFVEISPVGERALTMGFGASF